LGYNKNKHFIGDDGRLYFNYAVGAVYEFTPKGEKPFTYTITACYFEKKKDLKTWVGIEYYTVVGDDGDVLSDRYNAEQVDFLLNSLPCHQIVEGVREELPLLNEEVELYYNEKRKQLNKANAEANAKLKGTDYFKNKSAIESLEARLLFAKTDGDADIINSLEIDLKEYRAKQAGILKANKIDEAVLTKQVSCELCGDYGLLFGGARICKCAFKNTPKIKSYCAAVRLQTRRDK
jgi:hypothetical protein